MGTIIADGATITDNGIGVHNDGGTVSLKGALVARNQIGIINSKSSLLASLGFQADADPAKVAQLLRELRDTPEQDRMETARSSSLFIELRSFAVDASTILNNLVATAGSPMVAGWIDLLSTYVKA